MSNKHKELPKNLFSGETVLITGGSRGIGRASALRFGEAGANVVINYRENEAAANDTVESLAAISAKSLAIRGDVSKLRDAEDVVSKTVERFGRIDTLIANAGIWKGAPLEKMSESVWDEVLDANLKGTWTICRAAAESLRTNGKGNIVVVSSTAGQRGEAGYSNYAASKGGQISFTKALSNELAPFVRVNAVAPGWVDTELNDPVFSDASFVQRVVDEIPLKRVATADDVALSIAFLASDWSRHITGEIVNVNGGSVLCG